MKNTIDSFMYKSGLPMMGGSVGALTQVNGDASLFPTLSVIIHIIIVATIGAVIGYMVRSFFDWLCRKI